MDKAGSTEGSDRERTEAALSIYTWGNLFSILLGKRTEEDKQKYLVARDVANEIRDCQRCEKNRNWLFKYSPTITFLQENIRKIGPEINSENVRCRRCTTRQAGGFEADYGILICANEMRNRGHVEDTMAHEMIHAYDFLRFKFNRLDLRHAACMEIRASTLSGECRFMREFFTRGQHNFSMQFQKCVRRRANLSVMARASCKNSKHAAEVVDDVWESCFNDTRPFDEIYK